MKSACGELSGDTIPLVSYGTLHPWKKKKKKERQRKGKRGEEAKAEWLEKKAQRDGEEKEEWRVCRIRGGMGKERHQQGSEEKGRRMEQNQKETEERSAILK